MAVDGVAAEGGQGDLAAGLGVRAARLGVLTGHAADLDHGRGGAVGEDRGHLEDGLDLEADVVGRVVGEGLGAVPAHEDEGVPGTGLGDEVAQGVDLSGEDERGPAAQVRHHVGQRGLIGVGRLLEGGQVTPCGDLDVRAGDGELVHHASQHRPVGILPGIGAASRNRAAGVVTRTAPRGRWRASASVLGGDLGRLDLLAQVGP